MEPCTQLLAVTGSYWVVTGSAPGSGSYCHVLAATGSYWELLGSYWVVTGTPPTPSPTSPPHPPCLPSKTKTDITKQHNTTTHKTHGTTCALELDKDFASDRCCRRESGHGGWKGVKGGQGNGMEEREGSACGWDNHTQDTTTTHSHTPQHIHTCCTRFLSVHGIVEKPTQ